MPVANVNWDSEEEEIVFDRAYSTMSSLSRSSPSALSNAKSSLAATSVGNYALFGGGGYYGGSTVSSWVSNSVNSYNTSLTRSNLTVLSKGRTSLAATSVGNYALFGGGEGASTDNKSYIMCDTVDAYNASLTRSNPTVLSQARRELMSISIGNYALFGGGCDNSTTRYGSNKVDAYDASLTRSTPTALSSARYFSGTSSVGNYALFVGGQTQANSYYQSDAVDAYNTSLTRSIPTGLPVATVRIGGSSVGGYALFGGGCPYGKDGTAPTNLMYVYNTSLIRSSAVALSNAKYGFGSTSAGNYALFGGGGSSKIYYNDVDAYNDSLTKIALTGLTDSKGLLSATSVGNYALFAGGKSTGNDRYNSVDAYNSVPYYTLVITIPPFSKYKFTENTEQSTKDSSVDKEYSLSTTAGGISGYIKPGANDTIEGLQS